jgi:hypothetical protein
MILSFFANENPIIVILCRADYGPYPSITGIAAVHVQVKSDIPNRIAKIRAEYMIAVILAVFPRCFHVGQKRFGYLRYPVFGGDAVQLF